MFTTGSRIPRGFPRDYRVFNLVQIFDADLGLSFSWRDLHRASCLYSFLRAIVPYRSRGIITIIFPETGA